MNITKKQLIELEACQSGIDWFLNQEKRNLKPIINALLKDNHFDYARWLLGNLMTHPQQVLWGIQSAELVIDIFEKAYPNDNRPRLAIQAAKDYLEGKITAEAAAMAARAAGAAGAAARAAGIAGAAEAAAEAAWAAARAAGAAEAAWAAAERKICDNALKLLGEIK